MARIRSVHPGLFTDESFVECSSDAQVLFIALWTESDDQGLFEWRPSRLHLRLLPTKAVSVQALLDELSNTDPPLICSFEHAGKRYGAIRNFRRWQKPKTPNAVHFLPPAIRAFVGLGPGRAKEKPPASEDDSSENDDPEPGSTSEFERDEGGDSSEVADESDGSGDGDVRQKEKSPPLKPTPFPQSGETADQMEEGGGRRDDGGDSIYPPAPASQGPPPLAPDASEIDEAVSAWNELADEVGLAKVQRLTEPRRKAIRARLAECGGIEGWRRAMAKIRGSPFLLGENDRGWRADLDFVCQPKSFTKLMEGAYDRDERGRARRQGGSYLDGVRAFIAESGG